MSNTNFRKLTGIFFIVGAVLVNVPYTLLFVNFDYPDILRQPTAEIFTKLHAEGDSLIYTWLAFAWVGLPILLGTVMLKRVLEKEASPFLETATTLGVIGFVVQVIGLTGCVRCHPPIRRSRPW